MFLYSAAEHSIKNQKITSSGGIVPNDIVSKQAGGKLIVAVADNWDHNEWTVYDKRKTHAMTSILVSESNMTNLPCPRLKNVASKTFDMKLLSGGSLCSIIHYQKPHQRPISVFKNPVSLEEISPLEPKVVAKLKELLYSLGRISAFCDDIAEENKIPPWNVFYANSVNQEDEQVSSIAYNPFVMAKPSDYSTVYTKK
jgi:hypothetical protein